MKIYTIGRDSSCDIVCSDSMISRRHALLRLYYTGNMEIVDLSNNGTYINNVRIARNIPVPVRRKDNVSFAKVRQLDWTLVPNPIKKIKIIALSVIAVIFVVIGIIFIINKCSNTPPDIEETSNGFKDKSINDSTSRNSTDKTESEDEYVMGKKDTATSKGTSWYKSVRKSKAPDQNSVSKKSSQKNNSDKNANNKKESKKSEEKESNDKSKTIMM